MRLHDPETGLPGRLLALDRIEVATARCERSSTAVAVLLVDVPGAPADAAARLTEAVRAGDTVARPGGAELLVVGDDLRDANEAEELARRTVAALGEGTSVGLAVADAAGRPAEDLLREAGVALARAREQGGGCSVYDEGLRDRARARAQGEAELRAAIASGELRLHYQPVVGLDDGVVYGVEALVRWEHPEHGLLGPDDFVPVAEESGAIVPLGGWVVRESCRQAASWHAQRPDAAPFWLSVNVSARELAHPAIAGVFQRAIVESGLEPWMLQVEVAEADLASDPETCAVALRRLKAMGVRVAVDDASAGWRTHAAGFPVDVVKAGPENAAAVLAVRRKDVDVVVTGIEEREQETDARALGCLMAQGFLYARPAPAAELRALLDAAPAAADVQA